MSDGQIGYTRNGLKSLVAITANEMHPARNGNSCWAAGISATGEVSPGKVRPQVGQIELALCKSCWIKPMFLYAWPGFPQAPLRGGMGYLAQGQLELSNVNIVDEMVNMITAQRAYETNSKVIQAADQMLQHVNNLR